MKVHLRYILNKAGKTHSPIHATLIEHVFSLVASTVEYSFSQSTIELRITPVPLTCRTESTICSMPIGERASATLECESYLSAGISFIIRFGRVWAVLSYYVLPRVKASIT